MPRLNRAMADLARSQGADVLLSGNGADELLGSVRYLVGPLLRAGQWRSALRYLHDLRAGGSRRFATEGISLFAAWLPARFSLPWYCATNWPELCTFQAPTVLTERFRAPVETWTQQWIQTQIKLHQQQRHSWAAADAWDALFPSDPAPPVSELPEREPFLTPPFLQVALATRLTDRYAAHLLTPYHRRKALVLHLYPSSLHAVLPRTKQLFSQAFAAYHQDQIPLTRCLAYGLVDQERLATCHDPFVLRNLQAIERWIRGAEAQGAHASEE
jgi:asparagine synthase (glutamine-hydrolysing)